MLRELSIIATEDRLRGEGKGGRNTVATAQRGLKTRRQLSSPFGSGVLAKQDRA